MVKWQALYAKTRTPDKLSRGRLRLSHYTMAFPETD